MDLLHFSLCLAAAEQQTALRAKQQDEYNAMQGEAEAVDKNGLIRNSCALVMRRCI